MCFSCHDLRGNASVYSSLKDTNNRSLAVLCRVDPVSKFGNSTDAALWPAREQHHYLLGHAKIYDGHTFTALLAGPGTTGADIGRML